MECSQFPRTFPIRPIQSLRTCNHIKAWLVFWETSSQYISLYLTHFKVHFSAVANDSASLSYQRLEPKTPSQAETLPWPPYSSFQSSANQSMITSLLYPSLTIFLTTVSFSPAGNTERFIILSSFIYTPTPLLYPGKPHIPHGDILMEWVGNTDPNRHQKTIKLF